MVRLYTGPILTVFFLLAMFYTVSMFVVPCLHPEGTVRHLDGYGNTVDNAPKYEHIDPFSRAIYTFADSQCHQKEDRSFVLQGNQMPMCARCTALFVFANYGMLTALVLRPQSSLSRTFMGLFPGRFAKKVKDANKEPHFMMAMVISFGIPMVLDGTIQLVTGHETTNTMRVATGLLAGWAGGLVLGLILNNIWYFVLREGPDDPRGWRTRPGDKKRLERYRERKRQEWERRESEYEQTREIAERAQEQGTTPSRAKAKAK